MIGGTSSHPTRGSLPKTSWRYFSSCLKIRFRQSALNNITEQNNGISENSTGSLYTYFNTSSNRTTYDNSSGKPTNNTNEDNYRCITVLCDNDRVVMFQMIPHYGCWTCRWNTSGNSEGNIWSSSHTTSYGYEQGDKFGVRWVVSSSGEYVIAYCPSYYYGSGLMCVMVRVSDGKVIYGYHHDGSYGHQFAPLGKHDFVCAMQVNTDGGSGMYYRVIRSKREMMRLGDLGNFNPRDNMRTYVIDTPFYSTAYPAMIPAYYDTSLFDSQIPDAETVFD